MGKNEKIFRKEKASLMNDSFQNTLLLSLRRQYSENETVKMIEAENSKLRTKIGEHESYIAELEDRLVQLEGLSPADLAALKLAKKRDVEIIRMSQELTRARADKNHWSKKFYELLAKSQGMIDAASLKTITGERTSLQCIHVIRK